MTTPEDPQASAPADLVHAPASGRLLRRAAGHAGWQLVPPRVQPLARVLAYAPMALGFCAALGLVVVLKSGIWVMALLKGGGALKVGLLAGVGAGFARLSTRLVRLQVRGLAALNASVDSLRGSAPGTSLRIVGSVRAAAPFTSAISGRPAVLAHYEVRTEGRIDQQVRGVDFLITPESGESILVRAEDAYLDARLERVEGAPIDPTVVGAIGPDLRLREALVSPGDRVEAIGVLVHEIDPATAGGFGRAPVLAPVLRGSPRLPLVVRRVAPAEPQAK